MGCRGDQGSGGSGAEYEVVVPVRMSMRRSKSTEISREDQWRIDMGVLAYFSSTKR